MTAWLVVLTIGLPWLGALSVLMAGDSRPRAQTILAASFAVAAGLVTVALLPLSTTEVVLRLQLGGAFGDFTFVPDGLGVFLAAVATVVGSLAVIFSVDYMNGESQLGRYYALVLLFIGAMAGLVLSGSLLLLFLFWEVVAFCSYALISFHNDDPKAVAGGIKALVITQLGGIGLLVGVMTAYAYLDNYQISTLLAEAHTLPAAALGLIAFGFFAAAAAKSAQLPFHTWLPDAMEAPTPVSALIHAATMVNAGVYLLARFYPAFSSVPGWTDTIMMIGVLSALVAALMALVATDLKRVLAYSTISQLGYMVYAVGIGAVFASQFHLLSHALFKALLFLSAGAVVHAVGTRDIRKMGGLGREMPFVRNAFLVGALALTGLPILNGFWSKELMLEAGQIQGPKWAYLVMLAGAGLTALYTFRLVWLVFCGDPRATRHAHDAPVAMRMALGSLVLGVLASWLLAGPFGQLLAIGSRSDLLQHTPSTWQMVVEVITAPTTAISLGVIVLGLAVWWWRARLTWLISRLQPLAHAAAVDFGFEWLNHHIITLTMQMATVLRNTQTGQLNWNVAGLMTGLVVVLAILIWAAPL